MKWIIEHLGGGKMALSAERAWPNDDECIVVFAGTQDSDMLPYAVVREEKRSVWRETYQRKGMNALQSPDSASWMPKEGQIFASSLAMVLTTGEIGSTVVAMLKSVLYQPADDGKEVDV